MELDNPLVNVEVALEPEPVVLEGPVQTILPTEIGTSVASGTFWNALNLLVSLPLGILGFSLVSHVLGAALLGRYSFLIWLNATLIGLLVGPANAATKFVAELRGKGESLLAAKVVRWLLGLQFAIGLGLVLLSGLVTFANILAGSFLPFPLEYIIPTGAAALTLLGGVLVGVAQAERRFRALSLNNIIFALVQFGLTALVLSQGWQVEGLLWALLTSSLVYVGLNWWLVKRLGLPSIQSNPHLPPFLRKEISGYIWGVAGSFALSVVVWQDSEILFLKLFSTSTQIGYYSAAFVLASRLILLPDLVFAAFLPIVCGLYAQNDFKRLAALHHQTLRYLLLASTPIAIGGMILAGPVVQLFSGPDFGPAAPPLVLLLLSGLLIAPGKLAVAILMAANDRKFIQNLTLIAAALNLGLAAGFVLLGWGAFGAALGSVVAQLGVLLTISRASHLIGHSFPWIILIKNILVAVIAFGIGALLVVQVNWPNLLLAALVGSSIYLVLLPVFGLVKAQEGRQLWSQLRHKVVN